MNPPSQSTPAKCGKRLFRPRLPGMDPRLARRGVLLICAIVAPLLAPAESRAIDFQFLYVDPAGQGFFDPVLGDQRRAAMDAAGRIIGHLITPTYGNETVYVHVTSSNDATSDTLGSDKPLFYYDSFPTSDPRYQTGTHYPKALADHYAAQDVDPNHNDMTMDINLGQNYYLGTDAAPPGTQYDLVSVALHELLHGIGFHSSFRQQGGYGNFGDGTYDSQDGPSGLPVIYDRFVTVGPGGPSWMLASTADRQSALIGGNLYWNGPNGIAGNGGSPPKLDASNPYDAGVNVSHLDSTAFPNDVISEGINKGQVKQTVSAVDRGMLRDMGWNISVFSSTVLWTAAGVDNRASTLSNWSQTPYPGDALTFGNNAAGVFDVKMDLQLYQLDKITFAGGAPAYTLRFNTFTINDLTGIGIENNSGQAHTFILESHQDEFSPTNIGSAATMGFHNSANADNSIFEVHGGYRVPQHTPTDHYDQFDGAEVDFYNTSTAATATFNIQGGAGDGANNTYGRINFLNAATAGSATINNQPGRQGQALSGQIVAGFGGRTAFYNTATAGSATVTNIGQNAPYIGGSAGVTNFHDTSTAGNATFHNKGATATGYTTGIGGGTQFFDHSTAATSTLINEVSNISGGGGNTYFGDDSTAGNANIDNLGGVGSYGPGTTTFYLRSTAGNAVINNRGLSGGGIGGVSAVTKFHDDSTAGFATIHNWGGPDTGGRTEFYERSTAGAAHIILEPGGNGGTILFQDSSNAGTAHLDASADALYGSIIDFRSQSTAASAVIDLGGNVNGMWLRFWDNASAGSATINAGSHNNLQFYNNSTAGNSNITVGSNSSLTFNGSYSGPPTTTAANAIIHLLGGSDYGIGGSSAGFFNSSTAANAQITVDGASGDNGYATGAQLVFSGGSDAGNATIALKSSPFTGRPGGNLFFNGATAPNARVTAEAGSFIYPIDNAGFFPDGTSIGYLAGAGTISLGGYQLTVGGLGFSTTFSGPITGYGGSFTKIGAGVFTFNGASTNTGLTTVKEGTLSMNGTMSGPVDVKSGATLKGTGVFSGKVTVENGAVFAPGNSPGTATVGSLDLLSGSTLEFELGATRDHLVVTSNGNISLGGILNISLLGGFIPQDPVPLFEGSIGTISGTFSAINSPIVNGRTFIAAYGANQVILQVLQAGDVNRDGAVNVADIQPLMVALSDLSAYKSSHDNLTDAQLGLIVNLNGDNFVNNADVQGLINLLANGGGSGSIAAVPEPASVLLAALAFSALVLARWRQRIRDESCRAQ
jgi:autotransporter-associated beta strand protein